MELAVETALPEQQLLTAQLELKVAKAIRVEPETANLFVQEPALRALRSAS
jgi:hypothetical protein